MLSEVLLAEVSKTKDHALSLILSVAICRIHIFGIVKSLP